MSDRGGASDMSTPRPSRAWQWLLIVSTLGCCWLSMMAVHELGHVLHAWLTGGTVTQVVLHPLAISRTDVQPNPRPQVVAWGGALWGTLLPVLVWLAVRQARSRHEPLAGFWAGFCLIANGCYLGAGSFAGIGDAGDLLRSGAPAWQLWLFGLVAVIAGLHLWNGRGHYFGLGQQRGSVEPRTAIGMTLALVILTVALWRLSG